MIRYFENGGEIVSQLKEAYDRGDVLALLQVMRCARDGLCEMPNWAIEPLEAGLLPIITGEKLGRRGRGNKPFGDLLKSYKRTVRASTYHYIRAWQVNPHRYADMPRHTIEAWFADPEVRTWKGYLDAARLANNALKGTDFRGQSPTIYKASIGTQPPVHWRRREVEVTLGLRGEGRLFGPPPGEPPQHVLDVLASHPATGEIS